MQASGHCIYIHIYQLFVVFLKYTQYNSRCVWISLYDFYTYNLLNSSLIRRVLCAKKKKPTAKYNLFIDPK